MHNIKGRSLDKRWRIPKGQSNKDNPEKLAPRPPSWDDRNYSYGHQLYPSDNAMFGSSLPPFVCWRAHVLFTLCVFAKHEHHNVI
jgi:hypothetical protein